MTSISEEKLKKFQERSNLKQVMKGGRGEGKSTVTEEILAQDQYKQEVMDGLTGVRREKIPWQDEESGEVFLQEFVRLNDGSGRWRMPHNISDEQWDEIRQEGLANEECARDVLTVLNGISNNNVALSNLKEKDIKMIARNAMIAIDSKLESNREEYNIESTDQIEVIMDNIIIPNILAALNKAKDGSLMAELLRQFKMVGTVGDEDDDDGFSMPSFS